MNLSNLKIVLGLTLCLGLSLDAQAHVSEHRKLTSEISKLSRSSKWRLISSTKLLFPSFHPQGMVKIRDRYYLSSVEVIEKPEPLKSSGNGFDRTTGKGIGHLFTFDSSGKLLHDLKLGEGSIYHPGGIDFDGRNLWVPVSEYRPGSRSIVYRVNPETQVATAVLKVNDHIGAVSFDRANGILTGASWGSRTFFQWRAGSAGKLELSKSWKNPSHFVDYQDCKQLGPGRILCSGISGYEVPGQREKLSIGGLGLVNTYSGKIEHEFPLELRTPDGASMNRNPFWIEATSTGVRLFFIPEDDSSSLYIYENK